MICLIWNTTLIGFMPDYWAWKCDDKTVGCLSLHFISFAGVSWAQRDQRMFRSMADYIEFTFFCVLNVFRMKPRIDPAKWPHLKRAPSFSPRDWRRKWLASKTKCAMKGHEKGPLNSHTHTYRIKTGEEAWREEKRKDVTEEPERLRRGASYVKFTHFCLRSSKR